MVAYFATDHARAFYEHCDFEPSPIAALQLRLFMVDSVTLAKVNLL